MPGNYIEQGRLQYVIGNEVQKYKQVDAPGWDAERERFMVGNRSRTFDEYSTWFTSEGQHTKPREGYEFLERAGFYGLLDHFYKTNGRVVWVDVGCGNGIALRQAKRWFADSHSTPDALVTYGVDALPLDETEYQYRKREAAGTVGHSGRRLYASDDLDPQYASQILQADASSVLFSEPPDIVTCFQVLQWTTNPLEIFANIASQMKPESVLSVSSLSSIMFTETPQDTSMSRTEYLFGKIGNNGYLPGFRHLYNKPYSPYGRPNEPEIWRRVSEELPAFTSDYQHALAKHSWDSIREDYGGSFINFYAHSPQKLRELYPYLYGSRK